MTTVLLLLLIPAVSVARDDALSKHWNLSLRLGSFSTSQDTWWNRTSLRAVAGLEITRYNSSRSALSVAIDAISFPGNYAAMVPITVNYKLFPAGNGLLRGEGIKSPPLLPWIGGGMGIYVHEPNWSSSSTIGVGAHVAAGLAIPMGSVFEVNGELRYAFTSDLRIFSYVMGFGFKF